MKSQGVNLYAVKLFWLGLQVGGKLFQEAPCARDAMDRVEAKLGLKPPQMSIDVKTGKMVLGSKWHGYEFRARRIIVAGDDDKSMTRTV